MNNVIAGMQVNPDLTDLTEQQLVGELYARGITLHDIESAYYHLQEVRAHISDETVGYSEDGLHGKGHTR